ncbi:unnamed protein product [Nippostrongylus brasiliensis]|uniref:SDR family NAD(P)-dependent oxidoreductase n=1 Tax=Nippostrongylus brasiliensis TaxID=27835 RepID=A0A0N4YVY5_NIPBR|nr:unnamed protein product [Nippostrongylus brasiliensis]
MTLEIHDSIVAAGVSEGRILSVIGDIRNDEVQKELIERTVAKFGRIDILVNNAGGFVGKPGFEASDEDFAYIVDVNLKR